MLKWKEVLLPNAIRRVLDGAQFSDNVTNGIERGGYTHTHTHNQTSSKSLGTVVKAKEARCKAVEAMVLLLGREKRGHCNNFSSGVTGQVLLSSLVGPLRWCQWQRQPQASST